MGQQIFGSEMELYMIPLQGLSGIIIVQKKYLGDITFTHFDQLFFGIVTSQHNTSWMIEFVYANTNTSQMVGFVYANTNGIKRWRLWMHVENVLLLGLPLIILGDFNYILNESNKQGDKLFQVNKDIKKFRGFIQRFGLIDLDFRRPKQTWCNNRSGNAWVWEQYDRVFAFEIWLDLFPEASNLHISRFASDHYPLLLTSECYSSCKKALFRFEKVWLYCEDFKEVVNKA